MFSRRRLNFINSLFTMAQNIHSDDGKPMHPSLTRLYAAAESRFGATGVKAVASLMKWKPQVLNNWRTRGVSKGGAIEIEQRLGISARWLMDGSGAEFVNAPAGAPIDVIGETDITTTYAGCKDSSAPMSVQSAFEVDDLNGQAYPIEYWDAKGSCGGGVTVYDAPPLGYIIKEASWFDYFRIKPDDAIVVFADGDSNADYIMDGDMVIFDKSRREPVSGEIFLILHPDGLRIKQLRRNIYGNWILESRNPDKGRFPDEVVSEEDADRIIIRGQFVYRQGGVRR